MVNLAAYLREAERMEKELASRVEPKALRRLPSDDKRCRYSRERLPSGCILFQMTIRKELR
jgi:hypothetical protein